MLGLGAIECLVLAAALLLFFGGGSLAKLVRLFGRSVASFRVGARDAEAIDITPGKDEEN